MYGWVEIEGNRVAKVSVKEPLSMPKADPMVIGTFTFKRARDFVTAAERMFHRNGNVAGEFYVDTCINDAIALGLDCRIFEVESYLGWGTPNDLRTFEYWQSCFHKWTSHPYRLNSDSHVASDALQILESRYGRRPPPSVGVIALPPLSGC